MHSKDFGGLTPNQVVAHNLFLARTLRGWTQEEASRNLEPHLGVRWSKATYSAAERSVAGERVRQFTADDLYAFSRAFDLPLTWFLLPPGLDAHGRIPAIHPPGRDDGGAESPAHLIEAVFRLDDATFERLNELLVDVVPPELQTDIQREIGDHVSKYAGAALMSRLGDVSRWERDLRELADALLEAQREAVEKSSADAPRILSLIGRGGEQDNDG